MKIGVFDSGVGGQAVARALQAELPDADVVVREDRENLPYGTKTPDQLFQLVAPILEAMAGEGCQVIVIACNTVTTSIIQRLREVITVPLVGMEPMVKPAAEQSRSGVIAVFATPTTLKTERYQWLKQEYCKNVAVLEPDCSTWAKMVEDNAIDRRVIEQNVQLALDGGADVIVLGCTHYHWIEALIQEMTTGRADVVQPTEAVIRQLKSVLAQLH